MTRRKDPPLSGKRFCGDKLTKQLHDLDQETFDCNINALIAANLAIGFDTIEEARKAGYRTSHYCLGPNISYMPNIVDISIFSDYTPGQHKLNNSED